jgi:hypothetical protein
MSESIATLESGVEKAGLWVYLLVAFILLRVDVRLAVLMIEPTRQPRWRIAPFQLLRARAGASSPGTGSPPGDRVGLWAAE